MLLNSNTLDILIQIFPEAVTIVTVDGQIVAMNGASQNFLSPKRAIPRVEEATHPANESTDETCHLCHWLLDDREKIRSYLRIASRTRTLVPSTFHLRDVDGEEMHYSVEGGRLGVDSETDRLLLFLRWQPQNRQSRNFIELTDQIAKLNKDLHVQAKTAEERRLLDLKLQETQRLESLMVLAGGVAHDFNNLLTGILGHTELALVKMSNESPAYSNVEQIRKATLNAADLARQMLAYSGRGQLESTPTDLNKLVTEMIHLLKVSIHNQINLRIDLMDNLPAILADATQIRQVVMNLITNASEAIGSRSGIISITTGVLYGDRDYFKETYFDEHLQEGWYTYLEVTDSGSGMPPDIVDRIFDPFFTTKFTGRGLGLAAVLGIIRGHNGAIRVYSELGKGTTFKIILPSIPQKEQPKAEMKETEVDYSGAVLVVDDNEPLRNVVKLMLEDIGFDVLTAADGKEGVAIFSQHKDAIRLVLLDLTMPYMDGPTAFQEMNRIQPGVKVILCSGYSEYESVHRFTGRGLVGYLQKPFSRDSLIKTVSGVLNGIESSGTESSGTESRVQNQAVQNETARDRMPQI